MESWLKKNISSAEVFRAHFTTFSIACTELWVDEYTQMITVEVKGKDPKYLWEIIGIYRAPNEDMLAMENW
jgi:hypothetical protein